MMGFHLYILFLKTVLVLKKYKTYIIFKPINNEYGVN